jgi:uncharacterized membrane protein YkvA (DUF1232 family)
MRAGANLDPRTLKRWLIAIAVVYLLFPRDLVPDYLGRGLGFIDDVLLIGLLRHFYLKRLRQSAARAAGSGPGPGAREGERPAPPPASERPVDAYATLGVSASASQEAIASAYKARMSEYHPDKVAHLGEDLQKLAHRKALEIQEAYRQLRR